MMEKHTTEHNKVMTCKKIHRYTETATFKSGVRSGNPEGYAIPA